MEKIKKGGQVWVETAIYTLIGLTIIGILLATTLPRIEKMKDKEVLKQTIIALESLDNKILDVRQAEGSIRKLYFKLAKGRLEINSKEDFIEYILEDTIYEASEPNETIEQGNLILRTEKFGDKYNIFLKMNYNDLNITYNKKEELKTLHPGTTPYGIQVENLGYNVSTRKTNINFNLLN